MSGACVERQRPSDLYDPDGFPTLPGVFVRRRGPRRLHDADSPAAKSPLARRDCFGSCVSGAK